MLTNINIHFYLAAYFIGAIPFGLILAKTFARTDIRSQGSQSIGATNVLRVLKQTHPKLAKKLAIATVILDALKGLLPILLAASMGLSVETQWTIGVLAVIGHCFSPYLKFEGGKGVATAVGVLLYFLPLETLIAFAVWYLLGRTVRISSVSSLGALTTLIISSFLIHYDMPHIHTHAPLFVIAFIVLYKHIPNLMRLVSGQEKQVI
ncbi:MAG: glycerol-3-phosphate 1-O-acyltransferase PlsY [Campylobacterales bacterium]|nr:glycerol-3-phosphate 1-O-acyltransferase PlsY [Campylobacterales bacterium]